MDSKGFKAASRRMFVYVVAAAVVCNVLLAVFATFSFRGDGVSFFSHRWIGQIMSVDPEAGVVSVASADGKKIMRFRVEPSRTRIVRDGQPARLADLQSNDDAVMYYRWHYVGWIATELTIISHRET